MKKLVNTKIYEICLIKKTERELLDKNIKQNTEIKISTVLSFYEQYAHFTLSMVIMLIRFP